MKTEISSATELKTLIQAGWELWYMAHPRCHPLPGSWQMRYRNQTRQVHWDAIERARRNLKWWDENTDEVEVGRNWCYRPKQKSLQMH